MRLYISFFLFYLFHLHIIGGNSFIIPDEVPSILSVIYSNIPVLKKGTDSRLGWGFRLGNRADFQVLVELGPQKNTIPLGNQPDPGSTNSKRNALNSLRDTLWAQRQKEKKEKSEAGKWLQNWSEEQIQPEFELGIGEIDAKSVIPPDAADQLVKLYDNGREGAARQLLPLEGAENVVSTMVPANDGATVTQAPVEGTSVAKKEDSTSSQTTTEGAKVVQA